MEIISLGSNCAVCYHLVNLGLRTNAYPFDWTKLSLNNLINVLTNKFAGFNDLVVKKYSQDHPIMSDTITTSGSIILTNKLNIQFAHELSSSDELADFSNILSRRVNRFLNLTNLTFVRLETENLTLNQMDGYNKLVELLDGLFTNYKLIVISKLKPSNNKIIWVELESFESDWKYPKISWANIFNL
jgi:hypothetical protein